jgi:hypothetical protein
MIAFGLVFPVATSYAHCRIMNLSRGTLVLSFLFFLVSCKPAAKTIKGPDQRLKWNLATLVDDYERVGKHSPQWDEPAREALRAFAQIRSQGKQNPAAQGELANFCRTAVDAGCDDPMIRYLYVRNEIGWYEKATPEVAEAYRSADEGLQQSQYSAIRKFYGSLRAAEALKAAAPNRNKTPPEVHHARRHAAASLREVVADKTTPIEEVYEACHGLMEATESNKPQYEEFYLAVRDALLRNWPKESLALLLEGDFHIQYAWHARGSGFADTVTKEGWKLFAKRLAIAEKALDKAWRLDPKNARIAIIQLTLELGQGRGRPRMEMWFQRAMELDANNYTACNRKLFYLEPKWYGSSKEMLQFGRECVASKKWGGRVPLILIDAHDAVARYIDKDKRHAYWEDPSVWPDIKGAFEKFFELNPDAISWRHNYAWYAYACGQWDDFNEQVQKMGEVNYAYFGGKEKFEEMVDYAREHATKNPK